MIDIRLLFKDMSPEQLAVFSKFTPDQLKALSGTTTIIETPAKFVEESTIDKIRYEFNKRIHSYSPRNFAYCAYNAAFMDRSREVFLKYPDEKFVVMPLDDISEFYDWFTGKNTLITTLNSLRLLSNNLRKLIRDICRYSV